MDAAQSQPARKSFTRLLLSLLSGLIVLLLLSYAGEQLYRSFVRDRWQTLGERRSAAIIEESINAFVGVQRSSRRLSTEIGRQPAVVRALRGDQRDRAEVFAELSRHSREEGVGIEIYDRRAELVAWDGPGGPPLRREILIALEGSMGSRVTRTPVSSQLSLVTPVRDDGLIIGAILIRRIIEVEYPLNPALIASEGLARRLGKDLGVDVAFSFAPDAEPVSDSVSVSAAVYGLDSSRVGVVTLTRPSGEAHLEKLGRGIEAFRAVVVLLLCGVLAAWTWQRWLRNAPVALRLPSLMAALWAFRYLLLWLGLPSSYLQTGIFDPALFASQFGFGLARSLGELSVTTIALVLSTFLALPVLFRRDFSRAARWPMLVRIVAAVSLSFLIFWMLRGYAAIVRSAVFDSTLVYNDTRVLMPGLELWVMMLNLLAISLCVFSVAVAVVAGLMRQMRSGVMKRADLGVIAASLLLAALLAGELSRDPLTATAYRLVVALLVLGAAWMVARWPGGLPLPPSGTLLTALIASVVLLFPLLEENARERDRVRVEMLARDAVRPVDDWLKFVVVEALRGFGTEAVTEALATGDAEEVSSLAFTRWAQSLVSQQGYPAVFALVDSGGEEISNFSIGGLSGVAAPVDAALETSRFDTLLVQDVAKGSGMVKVYGGSLPVYSSEGVPVAYARVVIVAGQQSLFRGERPLILQPAAQQELSVLYRRIAIAQFRGGIPVDPSASGLPIGYQLPVEVMTSLADSPVKSLWREETIDDRHVETFYLTMPGTEHEVVSIALPQSALLRYFLAGLKTAVVALLIALVLLFLQLLIRLLRGEQLVLTFRTRVLSSLLVTALIPFALLALYGRYQATERLTEATTVRLQDQTSAVASNLMMGIGRDERDVIVQVTPPVAEAIAGDLGTDFNLYVGDQLVVSSRPELYEVGILDRRLSGSAYANIYLKGRRFHLEQERIGRREYAVGYRPLLDSEGSIISVVSVPTLYTQEEIEEELALRNAVLLGTYAVLLGFLLLIATSFAQRISAPIMRLTEATRQVARGDLDVTVVPRSGETRPRYDEIGELMRSFDAMTGELKRSREELIRFERELAWKEMARQIAHEIKNPLTPMRLSLQHLRQLFKDRAQDFDQAFENISRTVIDQIDTLSRIASEFSNFARMPKRSLERLEVNTVLQEATQLFAQEGGIHFETRYAAVLPAVEADREELRRAFINILRNSIQALEGKGTVAVETSIVPGAVRVVIRDTGPGIPDEVKARLFEPVISTKPDGMGLGLAIVKKTIDDLGGAITLDSAAGKGTVVTIDLPAAGEE